jgi:urease accessory protein
MILHVTEILGDSREACYAGRRRETVTVGSADAAKRRLRLRTDAGTDVGVDLPRGSYLREGAVLADDGSRIVVVERALEQALVIRLPSGLAREALIGAAARIGHAFGNQHTPMDVDGEEIRVPITTSAELAEQTVRGLELGPGIELAVEDVRLGCHGPLTTPAHGHGHGHEH